MTNAKALSVGDILQYGDIEVGKKELSIAYRIKELKQKVVNWEATKEEKEELALLN